MKFLVVILVLVVLWLLLRGTARRARGDDAPRRSRPTSAPPAQPMLVCAHCGLHLPRDEALPGRGGVFCGEAHRAAYEQQHPVR
ncbi:MAG TPA: PP0621 family protein [Burkholderiaceae bacterium]|nr:PP0621 family protein [Burkholderiaceae bacterium]